MLKKLITAGLVASALALTATASDARTMAAPAHMAQTAKGSVLVDSRGMTLYTYAKDTAGKSNCYLGCAIAWPPFFASMDAEASGNWTVIKHGMRNQWAYKGHPLYFYTKDKKAGDVTGDGVGGVWYVAR